MNDETYIDEGGNRLIAENGSLWLQLKARNRPLRIGSVYTENGRRVMVTLRKSDRHLFRKMDAYGFNYAMLTKMNIDFVKLVEDKDTVYMIPVSAINEIGRLDKLNFASVGYELQRFISRDDLRQFRIA